MQREGFAHRDDPEEVGTMHEDSAQRKAIHDGLIAGGATLSPRARFVYLLPGDCQAWVSSDGEVGYVTVYPPGVGERRRTVVLREMFGGPETDSLDALGESIEVWEDTSASEVVAEVFALHQRMLEARAQ